MIDEDSIVNNALCLKEANQYWNNRFLMDCLPSPVSQIYSNVVLFT